MVLVSNSIIVFVTRAAIFLALPIVLEDTPSLHKFTETASQRLQHSNRPTVEHADYCDERHIFVVILRHTINSIVTKCYRLCMCLANDGCLNLSPHPNI